MQLSGANVLVVDDEQDLRSIFMDWFEREGCRVLVAGNGAEAIKLIEGKHVDVVVSDVRMPMLDGVTLLRNIKAGKDYKPSVIFVSGFCDIGAGEAFDLGVEAMMSKPVNRKELISAVSRVLATRDDLWKQRPMHTPKATLNARFKSLETALSEGLLAFGRGGFRIRSTAVLREGPVNLKMAFEDYNRRLTGQGVVRWIAPAEGEIGVEITYIDDENRHWIIGLTQANKTYSFIPCTSSVASAAKQE